MQLKADAEDGIAKQTKDNGRDAGEDLCGKPDGPDKPPLLRILGQVYRTAHTDRHGNEQGDDDNIERIDHHGENPLAACPAGGIGAREKFPRDMGQAVPQNMAENRDQYGDRAEGTQINQRP